MKRQRIAVTSAPAFTVEWPWETDGDDVVGPDGLLTQISTALVKSHEKGRYVFPLSETWRRGRVVYVFREKDRAEVVRIFASVGIDVPEASS